MHRFDGFVPRTFALLFLAACSQGTPPPGDTLEAEATPAAWLPVVGEPAACPDGGRLQASFYGALEGNIDWDARDMSCEGMPRPAGAGARLRFAGSAGEDELAIAVIIAIPQLERGKRASDLPTNVTIIEEGKGRFFSTTKLDYCWVDVEHAGPVPDAAMTTAVGGTLSCIAPLAETNGDTSVTISDLRFSGFVDWSGG